MPADTSEAAIRASPMRSAFSGGSILPEDSDLPFVLVITASMSRSMYEVRTLQPALAATATAAPESKTAGAQGRLLRLAETIMAPREVKTRRKTSFGLVTST